MSGKGPCKPSAMKTRFLIAEAPPELDEVKDARESRGRPRSKEKYSSYVLMKFSG